MEAAKQYIIGLSESGSVFFWSADENDEIDAQDMEFRMGESGVIQVIKNTEDNRVILRAALTAMEKNLSCGVCEDEPSKRNACLFCDGEEEAA